MLEKFVKVLLEEVLAKMQKDSQVHLLMAYVELYLCGNEFTSHLSCSNAMTLRPSFGTQFQIYHHQKAIEEKLKYHHIIEAKSSFRGSQINTKKCLKYINEYNSFLERADNFTQVFVQFWKVVLESKPDAEKFNSYGREITTHLQESRESYKKIMVLTPNNTIFLHKYAMFLKVICNDELESHDILSRKTEIREQQNIGSSRNQKVNTLAPLESDGSILMLKTSGEQNTLCRILDANSEAESTLGYSRRELIGLSANKLMLPHIAQVHDEWVLSFYGSQEINVLNNATMQFVKNKEGNFMTADLLINVLPCLNNGIEFLVFINPFAKCLWVPDKVRKLERRPAVLICDEKGRVIGITKECTEYFGIPRGIIDSGVENILKQFIPEIEKSGYQKFSKQGGDFGMFYAKVLTEICLEIEAEYLYEEIKENGKGSKANPIKK